MSGIFYNILNRVPAPYDNVLLTVNPMALLIQSARNCVIYQTHPYYALLGVWFLVSVVLCIVGVRMIAKYENSYVKVI